MHVARPSYAHGVRGIDSDRSRPGCRATCAGNSKRSPASHVSASFDAAATSGAGSVLYQRSGVNTKKLPRIEIADFSQICSFHRFASTLISLAQRRCAQGQFSLGTSGSAADAGRPEKIGAKVVAKFRGPMFGPAGKFLESPAYCEGTLPMDDDHQPSLRRMA
jgi:hypothetical protein